MNPTIPFSYFLDKAQEDFSQTRDYTHVCLEALRAKSKNSKSLEVIAEEMEKICVERRAYQLALEASPPATMDESVLPPLAPLHCIDGKWFFFRNNLIVQAMERVRWTPTTLPHSLSLRDREQISQYFGLEFKEYCALPFVRPALKHLLFKKLAQATSLEEKIIDTKMYQDIDFIENKLFYRTNKAVKALQINLSNGTAEEQEQVRQLQGTLYDVSGM